jgi:hypothetical protein
VTVAYPVELLTQAALAQSCGHLRARRHTDSGGRVRCIECERERKRDYDARRSSRDARRRDVPSRVVNLPIELVPEESLPKRPATRAGCADVPRPCPFVSCRFNLYLDVTRSGLVRLSFPDLEPDEMPAARSCALDVAEQGGLTQEETAAAVNVVRVRLQQIEGEALRKLRRRLPVLLGEDE